MLNVRQPVGPLSAFVSSIWDYESAPMAHAFDRMMPNGQMGLIVNLRDDRINVYDDEVHALPGVILAGPYTRPFMIETAQQCRTMGLSFRPGAAAAFLGLPAGEVLNADIGLSELWKTGAGELRERLLLAGSPQARLAVFEMMLERRLARARIPDRVIAPALQQIQQAPERISVAGLAEQFGFTTRRLAQVFETHVGMPPKAYQRLQRFYRVLKSVHGHRQVDWTRTAQDAGYYDQAHFNHHFREYTGFTPSEYLAVQGPQLHHVPMID